MSAVGGPDRGLPGLSAGLDDLVGACDWAATPLGPIRDWPLCLRAPAQLVLASPQPMWIGWGSDLTFVCNDACGRLLGPATYPGVLGRPASLAWSREWTPSIAQVLRTIRDGHAVRLDDVRLLADRGDGLEEVYYSFACGPIRREDGTVGGLFCSMTETTAAVVGARRLAALSALAATARLQTSARAAGAAVVDALAGGSDDIAFALLYLIDRTRAYAHLAHASGVSPGAGHLRPDLVALGPDGPAGQVWPIAEVASTAEARVVSVRGLDGFRADARGLHPAEAFVMPVVAGDQDRPEAVLVAGIAPARRLDADCQAFLALAADRAAMALAHARVRQAPDWRETRAADAAIDRRTVEGRERERLDGILRQATVGFAQVDLTGRFELVNQRYCDIVGRSRDDLMGLRIQEITHPDDLPAALVLLQRVVESGEDFVIEKRYVRPDGSVVWVTNSVYALKDERGRPEHVVAISLDVTAQRQAQEALRLSEARYRWIFDTASVSLWEEDLTALQAALDDLRASGVADFRRYLDDHPEFVARGIGLVRIVDVNAASLRMFGAASKDQLLQSLVDVFEPETVGVFREALIAMAEGRPGFEAEAVHKTLRGERLNVLVNHVFPPPGAAPRNALVSLTDITAQKRAQDRLRESEAHFRTMADTAPAMLWITDRTGAYTFLSQGWYEFTGRPPGLGLGAGWLAAVHPEDRAGLTATVAAAHETGDPFRVEYRLRRGDGGYHWTMDAGRPRFDAAGRFAGCIGAVIDIHERREAEQALQDAYRRLEHTSRVKDEFLATLSHELRTPLNAVLGWSRMLRVGSMRSDLQAHALEAIERNAKAQSQLVEDLLDVSRIIAGKLQIKSEPVDLAQVIAGAVDAIRPAASAKGLTLEIDVEAGLQVIVMGDADRLQQVVWNLLSNAAKFTPGGGRVRTALSVAGSQAQLTVADTGQGISPAFLPHIFERFRQEDGTLARRHTGLGLGLSIVRHFTEAHGGTITAESRGEHCGATFVLCLPVHAIRRSDDPPRAGDAAGVPAAAVRGLRVLVVDDDADVRDLLHAALEGSGAAVAMARSAGEALAVLDRERFDVLVADIGMPDQDGYSLLRAVRALSAARGGLVPAIAVTAHAGARERELAFEAGFTRHLTKPVDPGELMRVVAALAHEDAQAEPSG